MVTVPLRGSGDSSMQTCEAGMQLSHWQFNIGILNNDHIISQNPA